MLPKMMPKIKNIHTLCFFIGTEKASSFKITKIHTLPPPLELRRLVTLTKFTHFKITKNHTLCFFIGTEKASSFIITKIHTHLSPTETEKASSFKIRKIHITHYFLFFLTGTEKLFSPFLSP